MADSTTSALTAEEFQRLILNSLNVPDEGDPYIQKAYENLLNDMPLMWAMYQDQQARGLRLRFFYVKRECIYFLMCAVWQHITNSDGDVSESLDQYHQHLKDLYNTLTEQIEGAEAGAAAGNVAIGQITKEAPYEQERPWGADPNARRLRGDPLHPGRYSQGFNS